MKRNGRGRWGKGEGRGGGRRGGRTAVDRLRAPVELSRRSLEGIRR